MLPSISGRTKNKKDASCKQEKINTPTVSLKRGRTSPNESPVDDIKQSNGVAPETLDLLGMRSAASVLSLPGPFWLRVVAPDKSYQRVKYNGLIFKLWANIGHRPK